MKTAKQLHNWACRHAGLIQQTDKSWLPLAILLILMGLAVGGCKDKPVADDTQNQVLRAVVGVQKSVRNNQDTVIGLLDAEIRLLKKMIAFESRLTAIEQRLPEDKAWVMALKADGTYIARIGDKWLPVTFDGEYDIALRVNDAEDGVTFDVSEARTIVDLDVDPNTYDDILIVDDAESYTTTPHYTYTPYSAPSRTPESRNYRRIMGKFEDRWAEADELQKRTGKLLENDK